MSGIRVLFIGGSGIISSACSWLAVERGIELFALSRGRSSAVRPLPDQVRMLRGDIRDPDSARQAIGPLEFDAVVDWVGFTPEHVRADIELFRGRTGQYVFISSASAYQTPPARLPKTDSTPLRIPFWRYSRDKIACEDVLVAAYRNEGLPGIPFELGAREIVAWHDEDPSRQQVDPRIDAAMDELIATLPVSYRAATWPRSSTTRN